MNLLQQPSRVFHEPVEGNYFVAVYPPFSRWSPGLTPALHHQLQRPRNGAPLGLYVHIPFCQRKCDYCYYLSFVQQNPEVIDNYVNSIVAEISLYKQFPGTARQDLSFIYFGGGTPSLLRPEQLLRIVSALKDAFSLDRLEEFTFECAPRSVRSEFLEALKLAGVTRVNLGAQSFDDRLLKLSGRIHLADDISRAFFRLRGSGFNYINLDLMVGLPGETDESWEFTLRRTLELAPDSVTIYQTEIPHNTRLYREFKEGELPAPLVSWEEKRRRLEQAWVELARGGYFLQSAYHAVKFPAKHPFLYQQYLWRGADLVSLGVAAFGYLNGVHYQNEAELHSYQKRVAAGELPLARAFELSPRDQVVREFILQLKLGEVGLQYFRKKYDLDLRQIFSGPLNHLEAEGFLKVTPFHVKLTTSGLLHVDRLIPLFYNREYQNIRYT